MTQKMADAAEAAAIERYRAMRKAWTPCWGTVVRDRQDRPRRGHNQTT
jgi:hypothetical protein